MPHAGLPPEERFSWLAALLPYVEQDSLYKELDLTSAWNAEQNRQPVRRTVRTFLCPGGPAPDTPAEGAWTHYVGITGLGPDAPTLPVDDPRAGFFGYDRTITLGDIKDGTSNTLMALETAQDNGQWAAGGPATVRGLDPDTQPYVGKGRPFGLAHARTILPQPGGANALMADASTRYLSDRISAATLEALATLAGGEEVGSDF